MTDAPIRSVLDEDHGSLRPSASVPTQGVTASGDDLLHKTIKRLKQHIAAIQAAKRAAEMGAGVRGLPILDCINDLPEIVQHLESAEFEIEAAFEEYEDRLCPAKNSPSPALGGMEGEARNAQEPLYGSQALPSASTTNIRALPDTAGEVEAVAWRVRRKASDAGFGRPQVFIATEVSDTDLHQWSRNGYDFEPLYLSSTVSTLRAEIERLREGLTTARDYVADAAAGLSWTATQVADQLRGHSPDNSMAQGDLARIDEALGGSHE